MEKRNRTLKVRIYPTKKQKKFIDDGIKLQRDMWNYLVEFVNSRISDKDYVIGKYLDQDLAEELNEAFNEQITKSGVGARAINSVFTTYWWAWDRVFKKIGKQPRFHSYKKSTQSLKFFHVKNQVSEDNTIKIPRWSGLRNGQKNPYTQKELTFKLKNIDWFFEGAPRKHFKTTDIVLKRRKNQYWIHISLQYTPIELKQSNDGEIGLDWGLVDYFIDDKGNKYNLPRRVIKQENRIARMQRILSRKVKGSHNFVKLSNKLNNAYLKWYNIKKDWVEKFTYNLCKNYSLVSIESLNLEEMRQHSNRKRRHKMNRNSWSMFKTVLLDKQKSFTVVVKQIPRTYKSSQICSYCGKTTGKKPVSVREFYCPFCGTFHDRDVNAAKNILNKGKQMLAETMIGSQ